MRIFEQKLITNQIFIVHGREKIALEAIRRYDIFHRTINLTIFRSNVNEGYAHAAVRFPPLSL